MKKRSKLNLLVSVLVGLVIFSFFLYKLGLEAVLLIVRNINFFYLLIYFALTTLTFFLLTWRWQVILKAYKKKVGFLRLLKQTLAGYAVSYVTPSVRLGGEPLRVYMLKKEARVDYKTGTSSIIMDKFIELAGTAIFGLVGLILLLFIPASLSLKLILALLIVFVFSFLLIFYYRTVTRKGSFSSLFSLLRLEKFANFVFILKDIEAKLEKFFRKHKKEFLLSFFFYLFYGVTVILEMKFLLLSFGIKASLVEIILALTILGLVNFIPVPAALGFLEAGQSGLFFLLRGKSSIGFALSLLIRVRALIFVAIGFSIISYFSGKQVEKVYGKK